MDFLNLESSGEAHLGDDLAVSAHWVQRLLLQAVENQLIQDGERRSAHLVPESLVVLKSEANERSDCVLPVCQPRGVPASTRDAYLLGRCAAQEE